MVPSVTATFTSVGCAGEETICALFTPPTEISSDAVQVPVLFLTEIYPAAVPPVHVPEVTVTLVTSASLVDVTPFIESPAFIYTDPVSN